MMYMQYCQTFSKLNKTIPSAALILRSSKFSDNHNYQFTIHLKEIKNLAWNSQRLLIFIFVCNNIKGSTEIVVLTELI